MGCIQLMLAEYTYLWTQQFLLLKKNKTNPSLGMREFIYTDSLKRILCCVDKPRADGKPVQTIARIGTVTECDLSCLQNGMDILEINDPQRILHDYG